MRAFDRDLIRGGHYGQRSCEPRNEPLRDAPDIFFRRRSAHIGVHHIALTIVGNYLSTVLDDFSRYIVARKLCPTMKAEDVISTLELFHPGGSLETNSRQEAEPPPISASSMDVQNH